jgi:hypothetical protein
MMSDRFVAGLRVLGPERSFIIDTMSAPISIPVRRRLRPWHGALLAMLCMGIVASTWAQRRASRVERLVTEIHQSGGSVNLGTTAWSLLWDRLQGLSGEVPTRVMLPQGTTPEWLRSWDGLTDLAIDELEIDQDADLGPELVRLIARHPLEEFRAPRAKGADEIAAALSASLTLKGLHLRDSDLTDKGLRQLPLEQLQVLNIVGTQITTQGLRELRRLPPMSMVVLDGRQADAETMGLLEQRSSSYRLWLYGPDVTDDTVQTLKAALEPDDTHRIMSVYVGPTQTSKVTSSAVQEWTQDVPSVRIMYTRDAEPGPPMRSRGFSPRPWLVRILTPSIRQWSQSNAQLRGAIDRHLTRESGQATRTHQGFASLSTTDD